ncbi:hypothetical protein ACFOLJ_14475 [Rugamonas sp. CCM 8940]|uniref:hypothetical protein n=1 Tax=Rugamonas sp. CCM 8940 TaxID=2765359 RepID=UPI0018F31F3F|nr:hypothetical protein [Rugamonas sp. CCM 8940]MBJ7314320.1 hypothetical protein [Rugamonas sp. CCM 8940]
MTIEDGAQNVPLSVQFVPLKNAFKEGISLLKDTLDVTWKLAPASLLPSGLYLWLYLKMIGWTRLFYESAMSGTGLIFFALAAIVMTISTIGFFVLPSIVMMGTVYLSGYKERVPKAVIVLYMTIWISWVATIFITALFDMSQPELVLFVPIVLATIYGLFRLEQLEIRREGEASLLKAGGKVLILTFLAMLSIGCSILPILLSLQVVTQFHDMAEWLQWFVLGACLVFSGISLFPGFLYLATRTSHIGLLKPIKYAFGGMLVVAYLVMNIAALLDPVSSMILRGVGIYSDEPVSFQLVQPELKNVLSASGLDVKQGSGMTFVTAYVRFNFAGTRLLCRDKFDPASASATARELARKTKQLDPGKIGGLHCAPVNASEIREFRP